MKNTNESGRSMVEMLGVLAIIGVLSIGGIAGYTMAMNKYQANEIVNTIVQGAVYCRTKTAAVADITSAVEADPDLIATLACTTPDDGTVTFTLNSSLNSNILGLVCKGLGDTNTSCSTYTPVS
ncbi:MAG: hypothetical protein J6Y85_02075 [Alphaproteobacteria bacterium]|nr:hypothetical protein [Alphaproteobacteria bacterium]